MALDPIATDGEIFSCLIAADQDGLPMPTTENGKSPSSRLFAKPGLSRFVVGAAGARDVSGSEASLLRAAIPELGLRKPATVTGSWIGAEDWVVCLPKSLLPSVNGGRVTEGPVPAVAASSWTWAGRNIVLTSTWAIQTAPTMTASAPRGVGH